MISVTIIEDDVELKDLWGAFINSQRGYVFLSSYTNCETALKHIEKEKPDVVLMDITLDGKMNGVQGVRRIKALAPETEIIMVTVNVQEEMVFEALRSGASGYLVKNISPDHLLAAIHDVKNGGAPMRMDIARKVVQSLRQTAGMSRLSDRERQVLDLICRGINQKQAADELNISRDTVKFHTKNIYEKLRVSNAAEAAFIAGRAQSPGQDAKMIKLITKYCMHCRHSQPDDIRGLLCTLTGDKPAFEKKCPHYHKKRVTL